MTAWREEETWPLSDIKLATSHEHRKRILKFIVAARARRNRQRMVAKVELRNRKTVSL